MACDISASIAKVCKEGLGGNSKFYVFNYVEDVFTVVAGEATAINPLLATVFEYAIEGDLNTLTEDLVPDPATFTAVNTQVVNLVLGKTTAASSAQLNFLAYGNAQCVIKDRQGTYHALGLSSDGFNYTVNSSTGGANTDLNGFTIVGTATTGSLSPKLDTATIAAFLLLVA